MKLSMVEHMDFSFENSIMASCLKISADRKEQLVEYQIDMLESNDIPGLLTFHSILKDDKQCFYYDITSLLTLSQLLSRRKLACKDLLCLLRNITRVFIECRSYLLYEKCLLIDEEMIYVNPLTLETKLVYLPVRINCDSVSCLREFLTRMMLDLVVMEDPKADAMVNKIISSLRAANFSISEFHKTINSLADDSISEYQHEAAEPLEVYDYRGKSNFGMYNRKAGSSMPGSSLSSKISDKLHGLKASFPGNVKKGDLSDKRPNLLIAALSQVLIAILIYSASGFLKSLGDNVVLTYFAVAMVVVAIDILIFRAVFTSEKAGKEQNPAVRPVSDGRTVSADTMDQAVQWSLTGVLEQTYKGLFGETGVDSNESSRRETSHTGSYSKGKTSREENWIEVNARETGGLPFAWNEANNPGMQAVCENESCNNAMPMGNRFETVLLGAGEKAYPELRSMDSAISCNIPILKDTIYIGRLEGQVDYIIRNNAVGKVHGLISKKNGAYYIRDLNSRNGTYVNNERICCNVDYEIKNNDKITFANTDFIFILP